MISTGTWGTGKTAMLDRLAERLAAVEQRAQFVRAFGDDRMDA